MRVWEGLTSYQELICFIKIKRVIFVYKEVLDIVIINVKVTCGRIGGVSKLCNINCSIKSSKSILIHKSVLGKIFIVVEDK